MPLFLLKLLNFKSMIPFIITHWKTIAIGGMMAIIVYQNVFETRIFFGAETIPSLTKRLAAAEDAIDICKKGNDTLAASIVERNNEVDKWRIISKNLEKNIKSLENILRDNRADTNKTVSEILANKTPATCEASIDYLRNIRKGITWEK